MGGATRGSGTNAQGPELLELPDGMMYLMRPVLSGALKYTDLLDGSVDLGDVALINAALYIDNENQRRLIEHNRERKNDG